MRKRSSEAGRKTVTRPPVRAKAGYERFRRLRVTIEAGNTWAGKTAEIREAGKGGKVLASAVLDAKGNVSLILPMPAVDKSYRALVVWIDNTRQASLTIPDREKTRQELLANIPFAFAPSVFSGITFPTGDFKQPSLVEDLIGPYTTKTTFYDNDYQPVEEAAKPGRYGAVVEVHGEGNTPFRRYVTLYRLPDGVSLEQFRTALTLPSALKASADSLQAHAEWLGAAARWALLDRTNDTSELAQLLAALDEWKPGDSTPQWFSQDSPDRRDARWWYGLRRRTENYQYRTIVDLPAGYGKDKQKRWPLLVFLHGSGERGSDLEKVKVHGPPKLVAQGQALPFIVVSPQCPDGESWLPEAVNDLIDAISAKYPVDPDRIYLTGLSMGGFGTWATACQYPQKFAAIAPVCGYTDPNEVTPLKSLPVWAFQGGKDSVVSPEAHEQTVKALKALGGDVTYTVYPKAGHDSWTATYANPELYAWLLRHTRAPK